MPKKVRLAGGAPTGTKRKRVPKAMKKQLETPLNVSGAQTTTVLQKSDARIATTKATRITLANQVKTIAVNKAIGQQSLFWFVAGYVSRALERGYFASSSDPWNAFYAAQYMENLVLNYVLSQQVPTTQLPYWLLCVCQAISPKSAPFAGSKVNYQFTWTEAQPITPTVNTVIGYGGYGNLYSLGITGGVPINGFPVVVTAGSAYTDAKGSTAFQELCKFMESQQNGGNDKRVSQIVPSSTLTQFSTDVSSFAVLRQIEGTGSSGQGGGLVALAELEVPLFRPILSLFGCGEDGVDTNSAFRFYNRSIVVAGDPILLSAMASTQLSIRQLSMKRNVRIKQIDFLEFGDVLAIWVQGIVQSYYNDVAGTLSLADAQAKICPLTLQEMLLLLRAVIMNAFKDSQAAVQSIYPFKPSNSSDNQFVPFVCGVNCCPLESFDMTLPMLLIENVRALVARPVSYGKTPQNIAWYMPTLGQYFQDVLSAGDYEVTYVDIDGVSTSFPVFQTGALWEKEIRTKEGVAKQLLVEQPISLVDGSSGSSLCFINDAKKLKDLTAMWNIWFAESGVASYSMQAGTLGTDQGINALVSIAMTRFWIPAQNDVHGKQPTSTCVANHSRRPAPIPTEIICDVRMHKKFKGLISGPYASRSAIADSSQGEILSVPYEQIQRLWILPVDFDEEIVNVDSILLQRYQFMFEEPFLAPSVSADEGTPQASNHEAYAAKMRKGKLQEKSDISQFLSNMADEGRGGILSGIVSGFVKKINPEIGGVLSGIADMLPI